MTDFIVSSEKSKITNDRFLNINHNLALSIDEKNYLI